MIAPVGRLKRSDIIYLSQHRCKHRHTYLEHYQCYLEEVKWRERRGYFDIETFTSGFNADRGILLCYCILDADSDEIYGRSITPAEIFDKKGGRDKKLVEECVNHLREFDRIYTWYGSNFDVPWMRARAVKHGLQFIEHGAKYHKDLYYVGKKFKYASKSLENMATQLLGSTRKTRFNYDRWLDAVLGDEVALNEIFEHCKYDVQDLRDIHVVLEPYYAERDTSI